MKPRGAKRPAAAERSATARGADAPSRGADGRARRADASRGSRAHGGEPPAWLFWALLAGITLVVFGGTLTLGRLYLFKDIGSDTLNNFYPQRSLVARTLGASGLPGWSFSAGMGQNIWPESLGDPLAWPLLALGPSALAFGIGPLEALKTLIAGGLFFALLRLRGATRFASSLAALGYACCGVLVTGGTWWYLLSNQVVHAALLLVAWELLLRRRGAWVFALAVALIAASNVFSAYLLGLMLAVYAIARRLADGEPRGEAFGMLALRAAGLGALGLAASAVCSLPSAREMLLSPRVAGHSGLAGTLAQAPPFALGSPTLYATELLRGFGADLLGRGAGYHGWQNYLEAPLHYCGLFALLLAPQAFAVWTPRRRAIGGVIAGTLLLLYVFPWLRHALWLFTGDYFRTLSLFTVLAILFAAATALDALARDRALDLRLLAATLVALLVVLALPYRDGATRLAIDGGLAGLVAVLLVAEAALLAAAARGALASGARIGLLGLAAVELAALSFAPVNERPAVSGAEWSGAGGYHDATLQALESIHRRDPGFHRIEKDYSSSPAAQFGLNDSKVQGYFGTSSYYSFNALNYVRFLGACGVIDATDPVQTNWTPGLRSRFALQTLASVRYWLVRGDPAAMPMLAATYRPLERFGDVQVFENQVFVPLGFGQRRVIGAAAFAALVASRKDMTLLRAAVIPDSAARRFASFARLDTSALTLPYTVPTYLEDARACGDSAMTLTRFDAGRIEGRVATTTPRMWVFSIPLDDGWSARVDDRPASLELVDEGLSGLALPGGAHTIRLDYAPPLRRAGAMVSGAGLLGLLALAARAAAGKRTRPRE